MIDEYLDLQTQIAGRAQYVGRIIQTTGHHAMKAVAFPSASPTLQDITDTTIALVIGLSEDREWIVVHVPIPMFEAGNDADIRVWVQHQNRAREARLRQLEDVDADQRRAQDIAIMQELMAKYPEVAGVN